jgi:uncharacterized protein (TIGR03067 family)
MKRQALLLAALALQLCPAASAQETDRDKLQGTWVCETTVENGKETKNYVGVRGVIDGEYLTWHYPRKDGSYVVKSGTFRIDRADELKHFDWWYLESPDLVDRRLYTLEGDTLRWSTNLGRKTTKTRPATFDAGRYQFTMKRVKDAPILGTALDPDGDCTVELFDSKVKMRVPSGRHDLWHGFKRMNAPRMMRPVSGDFTAQVKVSTDLKRPDGVFYHGAGLFVWESENQYLRVERNQYVNAQSDTLWRFTAPVYDLKKKRVASEKISKAEFFKGSSTWLRLERRGETVTTWISHDGQNWIETGKLATQFPDRVYVGIAALSFSKAEFTAEFEEFSLRKK